MENNFSGIGLKERLDNRLDKELSRELNHYWRNLVNLINAFIDLKQEKKISLNSLMQEKVSESLLELEKILLDLEKNGQKELSEKLKESLEIIRAMNFNADELEKQSGKEVYQKNLSRLLEILNSTGGNF